MVGLLSGREQEDAEKRRGMFWCLSPSLSLYVHRDLWRGILVKYEKHIVSREPVSLAKEL